MNFKQPILIVPGEPNSVFLELFFKSLKKIKIKSPLILIASHKLVSLQMKKLNYKYKINTLDKKKLDIKKLNNKSINLININYSTNSAFAKVSSDSNKYISRCFKTSFELINKFNFKKIINGPINKKKFLKKKYLGVTEYISEKFKITKNVMLIYNKELSVCPLTTHVPLKNVTRKISKNLITEKVEIINKFYINKLNRKKPRIAILGLNPHCESVDRYNEDEEIIKPTVNYLKKKNFLVDGPFSADTIFLSQNRKRFDVILGMYHDQVLTPIKTLYEYDAINITLGLPFIRVSPDHGPNIHMLGKNKSNPLSFIRAIAFLEKN